MSALSTRAGQRCDKDAAERAKYIIEKKKPDVLYFDLNEQKFKEQENWQDVRLSDAYALLPQFAGLAGPPKSAECVNCETHPLPTLGRSLIRSEVDRLPCPHLPLRTVVSFRIDLVLSLLFNVLS